MLSKVLAWDPLLPTPLQLRGKLLTSIWQDVHFANSSAAGSLALSGGTDDIRLLPNHCGTRGFK